MKVQKIYRMRDGRKTNWPHYRWNGYEVVDAGGFISIYFYQKGTPKGGVSLYSFGFGNSENLPHIIDLLKAAYETRDWYRGSEPPKELVKLWRRRVKHLRAGNPEPRAIEKAGAAGGKRE